MRKSNCVLSPRKSIDYLNLSSVLEALKDDVVRDAVAHRRTSALLDRLLTEKIVRD